MPHSAAPDDTLRAALHGVRALLLDLDGVLVLKGEAVGALDIALPLAVCALIAVAGLLYVARQLRTAAIR